MARLYDENDLTAAHKTLPMPSLVRVTNLENGRSIVVRINDRGPFVNNRIIDMSRRGAQLLGFEQNGTAKVRVEMMKDESMLLAAKASSKGGDSISPARTAAPAGTVTGQACRWRRSPPHARRQRPPNRCRRQCPEQTAIGSLQDAAADRAGVGHAGQGQQHLHPGRRLPAPGQCPATADEAEQPGARPGSPSSCSTSSASTASSWGPIASVDEADALLQKLIDTGHPDARIAVN